MNKDLKRVLHEKYSILKDLAYNSKGFDTGAIERVLTVNSLLKINEIYEKEEANFKQAMEDVIKNVPSSPYSLKKELQAIIDEVD